MSDLSILAIDPSTDVTGVALISFDRHGNPVKAALDSFATEHSFQRNSLPDRFDRIRQTRHWLSRFAADSTFDLIAYELPFLRGAAANGALMQAIGAYLSLSAFKGSPIIEVHAGSVKAAAGLGAFKAKAQDRREQQARRIENKQRTVDWANRFLSPLCLPTLCAQLPGDEAVADAVAVARAAWLIHARASQGALPLAKRPTRAKKEMVPTL